ncbi:hypothetical protein [Pseudonocardia sp. DLS-67]
MTPEIITLIGAIAVACIGAWATLRSRRLRRPRLRITDTYSTGSHPDQPEARPYAASIGINLADINIPSLAATEHPLMEIMLHNSGGQPVVLNRTVIDIIWAKRFKVLQSPRVRKDTAGPLWMPPSATYEIHFPDPEEAVGERITIGTTHVLDPQDSDRIQLRIDTNFPEGDIDADSEPAATFVYVLRLTFLYDVGNRQLHSRTVGVACPGNILFVPTIDGLRRKIRRFQAEVESLREDIGREIEARGQPLPDWSARPPLCRIDLPSPLPELDRHPAVREAFWNPQRAIGSYLDDAERACGEITDSLSPDMPNGLAEAISKARATAADIPQLRAEFGA